MDCFQYSGFTGKSTSEIRETPIFIRSVTQMLQFGGDDEHSMAGRSYSSAKPKLGLEMLENRFARYKRTIILETYNRSLWFKQSFNSSSLHHFLMPTHVLTNVNGVCNTGTSNPRSSGEESDMHRHDEHSETRIRNQTHVILALPPFAPSAKLVSATDTFIQSLNHQKKCFTKKIHFIAESVF
jgi:hypothetical protein